MAFDFKKEYKEFYLPPRKPGIVTVPECSYIAVRGQGDPNDENGEYKQTIGLLYGIAYTVKMSYKTEHKIDGFFEYVVPPLEGLWWQDANKLGINYSSKEAFNFISMIRVPEFVTEEVFDWAVEEASIKKKQNFSGVKYFTYNEGLCVQCMHVGSYDDEPATIATMHDYAFEKGYIPDEGGKRLHHEIYLSDPRKTELTKLKTVIRHPVKEIQI